MENMINNPGIQHLAENIFLNLDVKCLKICLQINQSCKQILESPMFWLKKFTWLSKENKKDWIKVIKPMKNSVQRNDIISYLQWNLKKEVVVDLPCYTCLFVQEDIRKKIWEICKKEGGLTSENTETVRILAPLTDNLFDLDDNGWTPIHGAAYRGHTKIVKILAPFTGNPNSPDKFGVTPIHEAAFGGHSEIVKILANLTDNPNPPDKTGRTPIALAAQHGYTEFVKILAPLTSNPNAPNKIGETPILYATKNGHTDIVKILIPLAGNPNAASNTGSTPLHCAAANGLTEIVQVLAPLSDNCNTQNRYGQTPIYYASKNGHTEIVKILAPLTDNPNLPTYKGVTPIYWAAYNGHTEIVKILAPLTDNPNSPGKLGVTPSSVTENAEIHRILETENAPGQHNAGPLEEPFNKRSKKSSVSMDTMTATGSTTSGWHSGGPSSCGRCASRRGYKKSE